MNAYDRVTDALLQNGCTQKGHDWTCPAHEDSSASLSVNEGDKGVVMTCHAGCDKESILLSIGLKAKDLFDNDTTTKPKLDLVDTYPYVDEQGELLFEVQRYSPKTFRQRRKTASGWDWKLGDVRRVLYRLPQLIAAVAGGVPIFFVEGEKDVAAIEVSGGIATTVPAGAGKWRSEYTQFFEGARVTIVADRDEPGRKFAEQVRQAINGVAVSVEVVEAKEGKDAFDHLAAGYLLDEFLPVDTLAVDSEEGKEVFEPPSSEGAGVNPLRAKLLGTNEIDDLPPPVYLLDEFLVADTLAVVHGQPGQGKSFLALDWALSIANGVPWFGRKVMQGDVLYVVAEGLSGVGPRKRAWQIEHGVGEPQGLTWVREAVNLLDSDNAVMHLLEIVDEMQPVLIVIDTLARSLPGADENSSASMSTAVENLDILRKTTGACVLIIHHSPKDGGSPRGHGTLLGAVQTSVEVENVDGEMRVEVKKQKDAAEVTTNLRLVGIGLPGEEHGSAVLRNVVDMGLPNNTMNEIVLARAVRESCGPEGMAASVLMRISGLPERSFHRAKNALLQNGTLLNVGTAKQPRYAVSTGQA